MKDKFSAKEKLNTDCYQKNQKYDYEDLLIRIKDIRKIIASLENKFLSQ